MSRSTFCGGACGRRDRILDDGCAHPHRTVALSQRIETEPHTRLRYFCSPHHQDSALYPFISQLERAAGFARDDTNATRLDKLEALSLLGDRAEPGDLSLIAEMLSLSGGERFAPLDLSPQRKKERTLAALLRQLQAPARRQPVLMIFEDLHWIDTSREVLDLTVERIAALPVLLVVTYRPEFQPPWVGQSQVTVIALNRLGRSEGATLVHQLAGNLGALPPDVVDEIVERTDGVPLFVEELTKAVVEAGADRGYASISAVPASSLAVPATLHASLLGRLDRRAPSGEKDALDTQFSWPRSAMISWPVVASQRRAVWSLEAVTRRAPSGRRTHSTPRPHGRVA